MERHASELQHTLPITNYQILFINYPPTHQPTNQSISQQKSHPVLKDGAAPRCHLACARRMPCAGRRRAPLCALTGEPGPGYCCFAWPTFPATSPLPLRMRLAADDRISLAPARRVLLRCTVVLYATIIAVVRQRVKAQRCLHCRTMLPLQMRNLMQGKMV
jgi:hypothetical protein